MRYHDPVRPLLLLCCLILSACYKGTNPSDPEHQAFALAPGEVATTRESAIRIQFDGVLSDSRCPADVVCVQAGEAIVRIQVQSPGAELQPYDLHTGNQPVTHDGAAITLAQLLPHPVSTKSIAPGEYRATLIVTE
jgi:hypothetical protein